MNTIESNMYSDADDSTESSRNYAPLKKIDKGTHKLLEINGEVISIVDPAVIANLEILIKQLQRKVSVLEHELRQTRARQQRTDKQLAETNRELDNKVGYE
jgi:hypothetical protein